MKIVLEVSLFIADDWFLWKVLENLMYIVKKIEYFFDDNDFVKSTKITLKGITEDD